MMRRFARRSKDVPLDAGPGRGPRTGMKRSVLHVIRQIPSYLRLLVGLIGDGRVSRLDRLLVLGALAYIASPLDFVPDFMPFLGQVDDVFLLMMAIQRLIENAGMAVLRDHWRGDPDDIDVLNVARVVSAAGFFLPTRVRHRLRRMAGRRSATDRRA
ncbi:MAG: YkvA family protein [Gemmatimonas sp.]|jgi:uncharacterized membrane protein YkvA (DUF1232 family)